MPPKPPIHLFSAIAIDQIEVQLDELLATNHTVLQQLREQPDPTWDNFAVPMQTLDRNLQDFWLPIDHLHAVANSKPLRQIYQVCVAKITHYQTTLGQDQTLHACYQKLKNSSEYLHYSPAQQRWVDRALTQQRLLGINLNSTQRQRLQQITSRLAILAQQYVNNVLDATAAWQKHIIDSSQLTGLPDSLLHLLQHQAQQADKSGYLLNLDYPVYAAIMSHADNRDLREEIYHAYMTRASDQGPHAGQFDNSEIMVEMLALRTEMAKLLGYTHYADLSLATKMADSVTEVIDFLQSLVKRARPFAEQEWATLQRYAANTLNLSDLQAWDIAYVSECYRREHYALDEEVLRQYFPLHQVLAGLFTLIKRLFDISIEPITEFDRYCDDIQLYQFCRAGEPIAWCHFDLLARDNKNGGAWVSDCRSRYRLIDGSLVLPVAFLNCNFRPATKNEPVLLSQTEVVTLFHEFGHALHHLLTTIDVAGIAGMLGVEWDAVELPSQFMENWCWQPAVIQSFAKHYQTGQPLPEPLLQALLANRNFNGGLGTLRYIEYALFDLAIHTTPNIDSAQHIQRLLEQVRDRVALLKPPATIRFQHGFIHLFTGDYNYAYAAGYYSYKWAEVLSADAFAAFEENGLFDPHTAQRFLQDILQVSSARPVAESFKAFRNRAPSINALLRHAGFECDIE